MSSNAPARCNRCGTIIRKKRAVCPSCGSELNAAPPAAAGAKGTPAAAQAGGSQANPGTRAGHPAPAKPPGTK